MRTAVALCLVAALFVPLATARAGDPSTEFPVRVHEKVLDNGLKVLVIPRAGMATSPCAIAYGVGAVHEQAGRTGMAHFLEHMMFKGTEKMGVKDLAVDERIRHALDRVMSETIRLEDGKRTPEVVARLETLEKERIRLIAEQKDNLEINHLFTIYREAGATFANAMTSNDWTTYIASLPPEKIELFFWVESDRLRNCIFRQFHAEKDVVREERRMYENRPGALFREEVQRALFAAHPYGHPILGYHEDLRALTREQLRAFWSTYYAPDNAILYVGGDVDPERIFELAERYFGFIPAASNPRPQVPTLDIPNNGEVRLHGSGRGKERLDLHYRTPAAGSDEALVLDFLAAHLGDSEGELFKDLVETEKVAVSFRARYDGRRYGGSIRISATLSPRGTHEAAEKRILEAIEGVRSQVISEDGMKRLRRRYRARVLGAVREDRRLGFLIMRSEMKGSWRDIERDLVRAKTLSAEEIRAAAGAYLVPDNRLVAAYSNEKKATPAAEAPTATPAPTIPASWTDLEFEPRAFRLPSGPQARRVLSNGIRAFVVPNEGDPVIRVSAVVLGGAAEDPEGKEGLGELTAELLGDAGIPGLSAQALKEHLDGIVGGLSTSSDLHTHRLTVSVFPADLGEGLRILRLLLSAPELDPTAFERIRDRLISRAETEDTRLGSVTSRLYRRLLWGDVPATRRATRQSLEAITLDDIRGRIAKVTGPERIVLAVSGDVEVDDVTQTLEAALGAWKPEGVAAYERSPQKNDAEQAARGLHVRAMPASQGSVRIGKLTVPRHHADAPALGLVSTILARRIFNTIRSVHGLSYQASARYGSSWRNDSPFTITFQTKCASVPFAIDLAREELRKLIEEGPTAREVKDARQSRDSGFRRTFGTGFGAAEAFAELEAWGVELDFYEKLRRAYASIGADELRTIAARHLRPERLLILCVGDVDAMKPGDGAHPQKLEDLGPATTHQKK